MVGLFVLVVLLLLLMLVGVAYQGIGSARDARRYPAPGQMVDVGGHRLHLCCMGERRPTVVMDAGLTASSLSWRLVQSEVSKFTRVCSYDRAGLGWSEPSPMPRTSQQIVQELHALLANAGIKGPYVLVGHSFGGFTARLYAATYSDEVVGMVLLDSAHPNNWLHMTEERKKELERAVRLSHRGAMLARLGMARFVSFLVSARAFDMARLCVSFLSGGAIKGGESMLAPSRKLPAELLPIIRALWTQPKFFTTVARQIKALPISASQVARTGKFGDMPLIVLSASNPDPTRKIEQDGLARLSRNARHIVPSSGSHWIQLDQPDLVIEAIREVIELARSAQNRGMDH